MALNLLLVFLLAICGGLFAVCIVVLITSPDKLNDTEVIEPKFVNKYGNEEDID